MKSLFSKSLCTCYFLFRWLVNDRARPGNINHTSRVVDVTLIHNISLGSWPGSQLHTQERTHSHTHWRPCTDGFSYTTAWGCSIGFKNTHNICKALWLIILVLQCNHAIWAWAIAEHEPYGGRKRWWGLLYSDEGVRPMAMNTWESDFIIYILGSYIRS